MDVVVVVVSGVNRNIIKRELNSRRNHTKTTSILCPQIYAGLVGAPVKMNEALLFGFFCYLSCMPSGMSIS